MRSVRNVVVLCVLACLAVCAGCEKASGLSPEQVWWKFMDGLSVKNMLAIQALATDDLTRQIAKAGPADFANLTNAHLTAKEKVFEITAQDKTTARAKVVYRSQPGSEYGQEYIVLFEKPGKNWIVSAIEGEVKLYLPGFDDL